MGQFFQLPHGRKGNLTPTPTPPQFPIIQLCIKEVGQQYQFVSLEKKSIFFGVFTLCNGFCPFASTNNKIK
jgi:hypothetical protein